MQNLITIGKIIRHQGNKGEVRVQLLTDFPERFKHMKAIHLDNKENSEQENKKIEKKIIEDSWFHKQYVIIKFSDVNNIGEAMELKNYLLKIPQEETVPLLEDEYYLFQLQGMQVQTQAGKILGELDNILQTGGVDIFVVNGKEKEYMIPASREIITDINEKDNVIIIDPIPGLLEL